MLLRGLPQDSRYQTVLRDTVELPEPVSGDEEPQFGPWSLLNYQLAALIDATNAVTASLAGGDRPEPAPRPLMKRRRSVPPVDPRAMAYLQAIRDRHRRETGS